MFLEQSVFPQIRQTSYKMIMPQLILSFSIKVLPQIIPMFNHLGIMNTAFLEIYNVICLVRVLIIIQATAAYTEHEKASLTYKKSWVDANSSFSK